MSRTLRRFRLWLKGMLSWVAVPIRAGPLAGYRFGLFTGVRFLRGSYGEEEAAALGRLAAPGDVVYDIGAHVGYFTLLASVTVGPDGHVVAFEPVPLNLAYLGRHVRSNDLGNVTVVPMAVGRAAARQSFGGAGGTGCGRLGAGPDTVRRRVDVGALDELVARGTIPNPDVIKMDIEGGEAAALDGATDVLRRCRPTLLLSTHGAAARAACEARLGHLGYRMTDLGRAGIVARPPETSIRR